MKHVNSVAALLLVVVAMMFTKGACAQSTEPYPTGGGSASPILPNAEGSIAPAVIPPRMLLRFWAGFPAFTVATPAWIHGASPARPARPAMSLPTRPRAFTLRESYSRARR
jgi:hypothetical protein